MSDYVEDTQKSPPDERAQPSARSGRDPHPQPLRCGQRSVSVMARSYPGAGINLGPAMTFGYLAALDVVAKT